MIKSTQELYEQQRRNEYETRLHFMHRSFAKKYAPEDPRERDVFGADLMMLLREIQIDALKPFHEAAAAHLAMCQMTPTFIKAKEPG